MYHKTCKLDLEKDGISKWSLFLTVQLGTAIQTI